MSEFSIEEKAKRYDEAIEKAEKWRNAPNINKIPTFGNKIIEDIFPELQKPNDEKIKDALIALVKCNERCGYSLLNNVSTSSMLDWIKKQGETTIWDKKDEQILNAAILHIKNKTYNYCGGYTSEYVIQWLESLKNRYIWTPIEKQGEQIDIANKEYWRGYREGKKEILDKYAELEKQGKETISQSYLAPKSASQAIKEIITDNANKIEPKFHEGDWVATDKGDAVQIGAVNNGYYTLFNGMDFDMSYVDKYWHKWTIQDAKDGDILSYVTDDEDLWIMIYQSLYKPYKNHVHYRALLVDNDFTDKGTCCIDINYLKPATKEQRELLFTKMKEAGYEWNFDKKELINIL